MYTCKLFLIGNEYWPDHTITSVAQKSCIAALISTFLVCALPAVADDTFKKAIDFYNAKSYVQAEQGLSETVRKYPAYWLAHYYLAHTYVALNRRSEARLQYSACLTSQPPPSPDVVAACKKSIVALGGKVPAAADSASGDNNDTVPLSAGSSKEDDTKKTAADEEKKDTPITQRDREKLLTVERLRKECAEKVKAIRQELKEALANGDARASQWYIDDVSGGCVTRMTPSERKDIEQEFLTRITKVQDEYERKIANLH